MLTLYFICYRSDEYCDFLTSAKSKQNKRFEPGTIRKGSAGIFLIVRCVNNKAIFTMEVGKATCFNKDKVFFRSIAVFPLEGVRVKLEVADGS